MSNPGLYYIYQCPCGHVWGTAWSRGQPMQCYNCHGICDVTRSPPWRPKRLFGRFECGKCGHRWTSGNTWRGIGQKCHACDIMAAPYDQRPLQRRVNRTHEKPHLGDLCEMCRNLGGKSCRNATEAEIQAVLSRLLIED